MPKRKNPRKRKKNNMLAYLILVGFVVLIGFVLSSHSNSAESYAFCEKLKEFDNSANNYSRLKEQLKNLCGRNNLSKEEQELGNLSVEFMESLSFFTASWKKNESIAKEYAKKTDSNYLRIKEINVSSSVIPTQVDSLYSADVDKVKAELNIQDMNLKNVTSSIKPLEEKNTTLTAILERMLSEEENKKETVKNVSLIYSQRKNESKQIESNLSIIISESEKLKNSFYDNLFPFLLIGVAIGGIIGFALSLKWKKERSYWDAYSSSAKVSSPLKLAALLTGVLIVVLLLYLFLSGKLELILTG